MAGGARALGYSESALAELSPAATLLNASGVMAENRVVCSVFVRDGNEVLKCWKPGDGIHVF